MKKMDELRQLSSDELEQRLYSLRKELYELRFQARCAKIEKPSRISQARHDIARILTLKKEVGKSPLPSPKERKDL